MFHRDQSLLNAYYVSLIQFALDSTAQIKKQIISFIETTCKQMPQFLSKSKDILKHLMDQSPTITKRSILCFTNLIRSTLSFIAHNGGSTESVEAWNSFNELREFILKPGNMANEDTLVNTFKMLEILVQCYSMPDPSSSRRADAEFSLDQVPDTHPLLNRASLQKEGLVCLNILLDSINDVNSILTTICKLRQTALMALVVPKLCTSSQDLPKFNSIKNESIRHTLKTCFLSILRLKSTIVTPFVQRPGISI
ncbi:hypothetical protein SAMD00019534_085740 [Acytostelium subglobosum LB1]|uniref:hypothetical protein n=1 Tax=Acytostelium subglobosum LB1 TaxID=1410327 RepID=UPI000644D892|nr:hypothetical protein SAMD00019534_085740 [Acytostelium subglobosum LB1]GAM25399.1 hypothetical protein SAMD00019534_085740 [Acytostelium subglobosum LB1]|eukprot:XP_012751919.1 hypothetical protein SAMD00019534_085740 [Acytostelium subglobosum LB1]